MVAHRMESGNGIRPARLDDADTLTDLTHRAMASWGYEPEVMAWAHDAFTVTPAFIAEHPVFVLEEAGRVTGFYGLRGSLAELDLYYLMVEPARLRTGRGTRLWQHAVATARALGASVLTVNSDPYAEGFYLAMGAVTVGEQPWFPPTRPTWRLKIMRFAL